jgi:hypothetical protein
VKSRLEKEIFTPERSTAVSLKRIADTLSFAVWSLWSAAVGGMSFLIWEHFH